ncbi:hypothetical protein LF1_34710 [Rubripirellula obstinata]|uniref:Late embryogenesis abundant protein n=1 Tax=Rubripirellula obstinata TaxID=406547 RepID=A0A5B1CMC2_9BACT|nr:hypothetical protein [Rubripirellula obstinata]KAA1260929.1 hypothetical protein LF1_34710 [Rubripirellula obstinata]
MNFDPETAREYLALTGSAIAVASTLYFWLIRANCEKAQLEVHPVHALSGSVLLNEDYETLRRLNCKEGEVGAKYFLGLALANNSTLPNAIIGIRVWIKFDQAESSNGESWREMDVACSDGQSDLVPINIAPLTTAALNLALSTAITGTLQGGHVDRQMRASEALPPQVPIRIEMRAIGGKTFTQNFIDPGTRLPRTQGNLDSAKAA